MTPPRRTTKVRAVKTNKGKGPAREDMSKNFRAPPFVSGSGNPPAKVLAKRPNPPKDTTPTNPKKTRVECPKNATPKEVVAKDPTSVQLPPPSSSPQVQSISRLVHQNVSETDITTWSKESVEENNAALTRQISEIFIRQATHHKEIRAAAQTLEKAERDLGLWRYKCEQEQREKAKLLESHKKELQAQVDKTRDARKRVAELEASQLELENSLAAAALKEKDLLARVTTLEAGGSLPAEERSQLEEEQRAMGQVLFMKSFMRQVPDFDWGRLGDATKEYAVGLAAEMEEEDRVAAEAQTKAANDNSAPPA